VALHIGRLAQVPEVDAAVRFRFRTPQHYAGFLCQYYGPTARLSANLDETRRAQFSQDLADLIARFNRATDGTVAAPADYLEAVGTRT
jgi:hypothetical protein